MEVVLLLRLLNPADCLLSRLLMFSGEYGLLGRGGAFSHLRCSRSAIVPAMCTYRHMFNKNHMLLSHRTMPCSCYDALSAVLGTMAETELMN
jgi:hypothetical protein